MKKTVAQAPYVCEEHGKVTPYVCKTKARGGQRYRRCPACMKVRRIAYQQRKRAKKVLPWMGEGYTAEDREKAKKAGKFTAGRSEAAPRHEKQEKPKKTIDFRARALKGAATRRAKLAARVRDERIDESLSEESA